MIVIQLAGVLMVLHIGKVDGQESGASPLVPDLSDVPLRNIKNITFFNGVFKNVESVTLFFDCLGSHFTWLQSVFTNFPALLNFVNKLKCVTGLCPKDLDDYGCTCRFEMEGLPIDATDSCCFQHRKCYEDAVELECNWDPAKITTDISCLTKNLTCVSADPCERLLCNCDKAAIECFVHSPVNLSMRNLDTSLCLAPVTEVTDRREVTTPDTELTPAEETMTPTARIAPSDPSNMVSRNPKVGDNSTDPSELGPGTLQMDTTFLPTPTPEQPSFTEEAMSTAPLDASVGAPEGMPTEKATMKTTVGESGFKMAEESTVQSPLVPLGPPTEEGAVEKVCERFNFLQLGENGNLRREVPQLGEMLFCLSGRCPQEFESYGCYCGHEGKGDPADGLDRCCFTHHCCLEHLKAVGCPPERIARSEVLCVDQKPKCMATSICDKLMCSCNKAAAECMAEAPINETLRSLNRRHCQEGRIICRHGAVQERPLGATGSDTMSSSSEESSEEPSPIRNVRRPLNTRPGAAPLRARQPHSRARGK
ncbi:otoconin-90 isoform X1 [Lissotriton helveticus]